VSFDTSNTFVRVRLPSQAVKTGFGKVFGVDALYAHASAVARITPPGFGGLLPFGVLAGAADGFQLCLRSSTPGLSEVPCAGNEQGNFGTLISPHFGNDTFGTTTTCQINEDYHTPHNLALGIDHLVLPHPNGHNPTVDRLDECFNFGVNTVKTDTGFTPHRVYNGLVGPDTFGSNATPARLRQGSGPTRQIIDDTAILPLDNQPLWEFIDDDPSGTPVSCAQSLFTDYVGESNYHPDATGLLMKCLSDYMAGGHSGVLFGKRDSSGEYAILSSPRLGFLPQFWGNTWGTGANWQRIKAVRPVFLQRLYFRAGNEWLVFQPGEGTGDLGIRQGAKYQKLEDVQQVTGFLLPDVTLPREILDNGPGGTLGPYHIELYR
jgi:hypothetical protein